MDELKMSRKAFDKIMRGALSVHPPEVPKKKIATKKTARKKS